MGGLELLRALWDLVRVGMAGMKLPEGLLLTLFRESIGVSEGRVRTGDSGLLLILGEGVLGVLDVALLLFKLLESPEEVSFAFELFLLGLELIQDIQHCGARAKKKVISSLFFKPQ